MFLDQFFVQKRFWFVCCQQKEFLRFKAEIESAYGCLWPDASAFDWGENIAEKHLIWHDYFKFRISDDPDFSWLGMHTKDAIRIRLMHQMESRLHAKVIAHNDKVVRRFCESVPAHDHLGMIFFFIFSNCEITFANLTPNTFSHTWFRTNIVFYNTCLS